MRMNYLAALIGLTIATPSLAQTVYDPNAVAAVRASRNAAYIAHTQADAARHDRTVARQAAAVGDYGAAAAAQHAARYHAHQARRAAHIARYDRHAAGADVAFDRAD